MQIKKGMASVKFYVHKKKSKKDSSTKELPIQVSFTYDSKRVITSSGETPGTLSYLEESK